MWKVTNNTNKVLLDKFNNTIVNTLFLLLLEMKKFDYLDYRETIIYQECSAKNVIEYVFGWKKKGLQFSSLFLDVINNYTLVVIRNYYQDYKKQNKQIGQGDYNVAQVKVCTELESIFVDVFYTNLFNDSQIWNNLLGVDFNRRIFHDNFYKDNRIDVCPFCDIDTLNAKSNIDVEHFLPKQKFPYLALNPMNLISSCRACNFPEEGKGSNVISPITNPYIEEIADKVECSIDYSNKRIDIYEKDKKRQDVANYLKLLKLKDRYSRERTFHKVYTRCESIFEIISMLMNNNEADIGSIEMYVRKQQKQQPLMKAVLDVVHDPDLRQYVAKMKGMQ